MKYETITIKFQPGLYQAQIEKEVKIIPPKHYDTQMSAWNADIETIRQKQRSQNG